MSKVYVIAATLGNGTTPESLKLTQFRAEVLFLAVEFLIQSNSSRQHNLLSHQYFTLKDLHAELALLVGR